MECIAAQTLQKYSLSPTAEIYNKANEKNPYVEQPQDLVPNACARTLLQHTFLAAANSIPVLGVLQTCWTPSSTDVQLFRDLSADPKNCDTQREHLIAQTVAQVTVQNLIR